MAYLKGVLLLVLFSLCGNLTSQSDRFHLGYTNISSSGGLSNLYVEIPFFTYDFFDSSPIENGGSFAPMSIGLASYKSTWKLENERFNHYSEERIYAIKFGMGMEGIILGSNQKPKSGYAFGLDVLANLAKDVQSNTTVSLSPRNDRIGFSPASGLAIGMRVEIYYRIIGFSYVFVAPVSDKSIQLLSDDGSMNSYEPRENGSNILSLTFRLF